MYISFKDVCRYLDSHLENPFPVDFTQSQEQFFQTLTIVQVQHLEQGEIGRVYRDTLTSMKTLWRHLESFAADGLINEIIEGLSTYMLWYAQHKGYYQFLDGDANGWTLSRKTPGLEDALANKLLMEHKERSLLLVQKMRGAIRAYEERKAEEEKEKAEQVAKLEREHNEQLHAVKMEMVSKLSEQAEKKIQRISDADDDARESIKLAMKNVQQAQDYVPLVMDKVGKLVESANEVVKSSNQHMQQQASSNVEEERIRGNGRKRGTKLVWFGVVLASGAVLPLLAFLLLKGL